MMQQPMGMMAPPMTADGGSPMARPHPMGRRAVTQAHAIAHSPQPASQTKPPPGALPKEVADDKPAMLSEGELVVPADVVRWHGLQKYMKMKDQAKKGLMQMHSNGQIQTTDDAKQHPAEHGQPPAMNRGGYMGVHPKAQEIPAYADGGVVGSSSTGSNNVYNAYLQTAGKTTPNIQGYLNPQGNFDFGYTNTAGGMVNPTSGSGSGGGLTPSPSPTPRGFMAQPTADTGTPTAASQAESQPQASSTAASAAATQPGGMPSAGLMAAGSGNGSGSSSGGGSAFSTGSGSGGSSGGTGNSILSPNSIISDVKSAGKFLYNQYEDPSSFLNKTILGNTPTAAATQGVDAAAPGFDVRTSDLGFGGATGGVAATQGVDAAAPGFDIAATDIGGTAGAGGGAEVATSAGLGTSLATAGAGIAGSYLGMAIGGNNQLNGGIGGAVGGVAGGIAGGALLGSELGLAAGPVGAFAGAAIGAILGSFLGPQHPSVGPNGQADVHFDPATGQFVRYASAVDNGGSLGIVNGLGDVSAQHINTVLQQLGGKINNTPPMYTTGYLKGKYFVGPNQFSTADEAAIGAIKQSVAQTDITGANPYVSAVLNNSTATTLKQFDNDLAAGQNYQTYLQNKTSVDSLLKYDPKNPLAVKWQTYIAQGNALGLDKVGQPQTA